VHTDLRYDNGALAQNSSLARRSFRLSIASAARAALYAALTPRSGALPCADTPRTIASISILPLWPR